MRTRGRGRLAVRRSSLPPRAAPGHGFHAASPFIPGITWSQIEVTTSARLVQLVHEPGLLTGRAHSMRYDVPSLAARLIDSC